VKSSARVVFDLDGTLIDSVGDLATAASELVTGLGGRPLAQSEVALLVGDGAAVLVRRALSAAGIDPETPGALPRFLEIYQRRLLETTVPYPGIEDMLVMAMRRARLAVLTNKPLAPARRILDGLGLSGYFDEIIGGDSDHGRKPDPAGLRSLGHDTTHLVLVGDSPIDDATATAAGSVFVWARYGFGAGRFDRPPQTPYVLAQPADLAQVLDRIIAIRSG
jgi:phosphoglycolate phosphatase